MSSFKWCIIGITIGICIGIVIGSNVFAKESVKTYSSFYDSSVVWWESNGHVDPYPETRLMDRIIFCESRDDPNAKNRKSSAYGLCQFLDSTWGYVQKKWNMTLDRQSSSDQRYACERLLAEEGTSHWLESRHCWK